MALVTKGAKPGTAGRPVSTGYDTDAMSQRFRAADNMGQGISPGSHPDPVGEAGDWAAQGVRKLVGGVKRALYPQVRETTPEEEAGYKRTGEMNYWTAKANKDFKK